jgi:molecular chaperone GrpE
MEDQQQSRRRQADDDTDDHYELDLDQHSSSELDEAIQSAVDAVERGGKSGASRVKQIEIVDDEDEEEEDAENVEEVEDDEESAEVEELRGQVAQLQQRLMRTLADFENYRKRTEREKETLRRMGIFDVVKDFLGVIDNLERAMGSSGTVEDLKQGLEMVLRQQEEVLRRHGVNRIEAVDEPFDPTLHEAVTRTESDEVEVPTVIDEMQSGYLLHERLLRPAMVTVAVPAQPTGEGSGEDGGADDVFDDEEGGETAEEVERVAE